MSNVVISNNIILNLLSKNRYKMLTNVKDILTVSVKTTIERFNKIKSDRGQPLVKFYEAHYNEYNLNCKIYKSKVDKEVSGLFSSIVIKKGDELILSNVTPTTNLYSCYVVNADMERVVFKETELEFVKEISESVRDEETIMVGKDEVSSEIFMSGNYSVATRRRVLKEHKDLADQFFTQDEVNDILDITIRSFHRYELDRIYYLDDKFSEFLSLDSVVVSKPRSRRYDKSKK